MEVKHPPGDPVPPDTYTEPASWIGRLVEIAKAPDAKFSVRHTGVDEITVVHHGPAAERFERGRTGRLRYGAELALLEERLPHAIGFERDMIEGEIGRTKAMLLAAIADMASARADMQREWRATRTADAMVSQAMQSPVRMLVLVADTSRETSTPRRRPTVAATRGSTAKGSDKPPGDPEGLTGPRQIGRAA